MSIELLFIIPVVALALMILVLILSIQKQKVTDGDGLSAGVDQYNSGKLQANYTGMNETMNLVGAAISNQQRLIDSISIKEERSREFLDLKKKIIELQNEYDVLVSENYTLKSKLRDFGAISKNGSRTGMMGVSSNSPKSAPDFSMLDDTKTISSKKQSLLDDTSEIDISDFYG